ncbi:ThuA domain-containing protein [Candidatus Halobonum tyrrellensis]|uniref:ThuA domain-containing protein n=1 Tax=Candidatus Halobonum tyrrellensis TaxID=1431545 RepID=UPI0006775CFE|nr:ThuA domain-containing protein [Candidatus Halobonum tyrrellensis]
MSPPTALVLGETRFPFHDLDDLGPALEAALGDAADATLTTDKDALTDLSGYDLVIDYTTDSTLTDDQREGLLGFVADGGGYLGVHSASDLTSLADGDGGLDHRDDPFPELRDLVGGHFTGHPEQSTFGVDVVDDHPVTEGVDDFEVYDEPYEVDVDDDVRVLARMDHPDLPDHPVVWVKPYGDGRVCYASLGHTEDAFETDSYRRLLRNAVGWVAGA